jgi:long-chain acyl-CoA synthetase
MFVTGEAMRDHLAALLDDFRRYGKQIAVVRHRGYRRYVSSYAEIAQLAGRFAALLERRGIGPGDRVLLWAENSAEWIAAFYGCILRGALAVPLDAYGSADFAARVAADVRPKLAVGDDFFLGQLPSTLDFPRLTFEEWRAVLPSEEAGPVAGLSHETPLQILFTSGTTGDPKGVVLTHGNVLSSVAPIEQGARPYLKYERPFHPLRFLHTLPLSHVFGQTMGLWVPPIFAAQVHFESRLVASRLIETIHQEKISVLAAVPRVHGLLKSHLESLYPGLAAQLAASKGLKAHQRWWRFRRIHLDFGLKFWALISGGGALTGPLEEFWNALGFVVVQGYGMTETTALITLNHPFHVARGAIGKPLPGREVKLAADGEVLVRGPMISTATWSDGAFHQREEGWMATGDLAQKQDSGDLHFLGRKSEVIVTAAGVNIHPEDLEAALETQPGVAACAVVPMETAAGPEACAVLALRGPGEQAAEAIEGANAQLAEFQRLRRWVLWPDPDLPRTSTGKVRRKAVAEWLAGIRTAAATPGALPPAASADWLLALVAQITGETTHRIGDELRLSEDLLLDSLGRAQLAAALEERLGIIAEAGFLDRIETLGELRSLLSQQAEPRTSCSPTLAPKSERKDGARRPLVGDEDSTEVLFEAQLQDRNLGGGAGTDGETISRAPSLPRTSAARVGEHELDLSLHGHPTVAEYLYPHWPWLRPVRWLRTVFVEVKLRPLVWLLANPRVIAPELPQTGEPLLIVANHVTAFDGPLILYALPAHLRRHLAVAMSGEMLEDYRHFRSPERRGRFLLFGPAVYLLLTALFNVFPLPRRRDFQRSFAHAGQAMDRGMNVLVFPEGTRSAAGVLARFRPGIGLLAKQCGAMVLPVALRGLGELKTGQRSWFRSGKIEIRVGRPIRFAAAASEAAITAQLHQAVAALLGN